MEREGDVSTFTNLDEALRNRDILIADIAELERQMRIAREQNEHKRRDELQLLLSTKHQWLREIKTWLRKHHSTERELLERCHGWIEEAFRLMPTNSDHPSHRWKDTVQLAEEGEMLLDAIEKTIGPPVKDKP
jgi:hypothetical protein